MTVVTGVIRHPVDGELAANEYIKFYLVDDEGVKVKRAYLTNGTIVGQSTAQLSATAYYEKSLPSNLDITPSGTRWARSHRDALEFLSVPLSGTASEQTILADPPDPIPVVEPSNESAFFSLGASSSALAVNGFTLVPVPTFIVVIPDSARPHIFLGSVTLSHATVATANLWAAIALVGETGIANAKGTGQSYAAAAGSQVTVPFIGRVPAHSAGSYQVCVNGSAGNVTCVGGTNGVSVVEALAV